MTLENVQTDSSGLSVSYKISKRIPEISDSHKLVRNTGEQTFITIEGNWLRTYGRHCEGISEKSP